MTVNRRTALTIHFAPPTKNQPDPAPIHVDSYGFVRSGLPEGDRVRLVGFGPLVELRVTVMPDAAAAEPHMVVGLAPIFVNRRHAGDSRLFRYSQPVTELVVHPPRPVRVVITRTSDKTSYQAYQGDDHLTAKRLARAWGQRRGFIAKIENL